MIYFDIESRLFSYSNNVILYHYTDKSNLDSIKKHGILSKYALKNGSNSLDTGLDRKDLEGLVYLSKSKEKNSFKRYSGLVTVSIPKEDYKNLVIVPDPYYLHINKRKNALIKLIFNRMKSDYIYGMYMSGQIDQIAWNHRGKIQSIEDCIARSAELDGFIKMKSNLNPKNTIVIKGDIKPEWIMKTEVLY